MIVRLIRFTRSALTICTAAGARDFFFFRSAVKTMAVRLFFVLSLFVAQFPSFGGGFFSRVWIRSQIAGFLKDTVYTVSSVSL